MNKWILIKILIALLLIFQIYFLCKLLKNYIEDEETRERLSASLVLMKAIAVIVYLIMSLCMLPNK